MVSSEMAKVVCFIIQKGGCGKTTTTVNTAGYLAAQGFRVLAVDMDPQGNLTQHFGYDTEKLTLSLTQLFMKERTLEEVLIKKNDHLHILPNNIEMTAIEFTLYKSFQREYVLRDVLYPIQHQYDFILIDCPPNLGILSVNSLVASTEFILVVSPEFFPMRAIKPLYATYRTVKKNLNRTLQFKGVLMTMCDFRTKHAREVRDVLKKNFPHRLYKSFIRSNVALKEAAAHGQDIFEYAPLSIGAFDYQNFAEEFIRDHEGVQKKKEFYESRFQNLPEKERDDILHFARQNLTTFNRSRLDQAIEQPVLQAALIIERNKILEKLYPYRSQPLLDEAK